MSDVVHQAEAAAARSERRIRDAEVLRYIQAFDNGDFEAMAQIFAAAAADAALQTILCEVAEELANDEIEEAKSDPELQARLLRLVEQWRQHDA